MWFESPEEMQAHVVWPGWDGWGHDERVTICQGDDRLSEIPYEEI